MQTPNFDITNFIHLLQKNQPKNLVKEPSRKSSIQSNRLSVIYSASQPQSSMPDKQNSQTSANKSVEQSSYQYLSQIATIFKELKSRKQGRNDKIDYDTKIQQLQFYVQELRKQNDVLEHRNKILQKQFQEQRKGTDEVLQALVKMDEMEKQLWKNYHKLSKEYEELEAEYKQVKLENLSLIQESKDNLQDIQFMKKLVLVANQNYQALQNKYRQIERDMRIKQRFRQQKSSPQITSRSAQAKKKSYSPTISDRSDFSVRRKSEFQENYRKMVLRTLKNKARQK